MYFDEKVDILPEEAFRYYEFFGNNRKKSFKVQFAHLNVISSNAFSRIDLRAERSLQIQIVKYTATILPSRTFEDLALQSNSNITIDIFNVTSSLLTVEQYAFDGIRFNRESRFRFAILYAKDTILFESNAGSNMLPSYSHMDLMFTNFIQVIFEEHSFDHITQEHSSELMLSFDRFQYATLAHNSFYDFHQLDLARFQLSLANFQSLTIEQTLFDTITQLKSTLIVSIYNLTSDLCVPSKTFSQIKQDVNSTFQFEINYGRNILFASNAFTNINQKLQSKLAVSITNSYDVYFARYALNNLHQEDRSFVDIWMKYGQNLIFEDYAINNIDINKASILRIGFQYSRGTLQMATNAFLNVNEGQGGEFIFQIMNSSDFYFRFNKTISLKLLEIVDRSLSSQDLCRVVNIPSHIPMKLLPDTSCSCTVYYLYRHLHRKLLQSDLNELTPTCYRDMSLDDLEYAEHECSFETKINNCQQMEGEIQIDIPRGICENNVRLMNKNNNKQQPSKKKSSFTTAIFLLILVGCIIFAVSCMYVLFSKDKRLPSWDTLQKHLMHYRRQKLTIYSADSYQQLTHIDQQELTTKRRKLLVRYNSTTDRTQPYLDVDKSDFIVSNNVNDDDDEEHDEDFTLKLNTNPMSDIEDNVV
ncbi:unnamed protein product [Adineta ricciae]|uniref:Uncharacterized protein n=1 Tax=Adineta ricciae TaxID=249248 RepID=A0A815XCZ6_ADIRI|nr:unnamed protein product [Adineta ricciae]